MKEAYDLKITFGGEIHEIHLADLTKAFADDVGYTEEYARQLLRRIASYKDSTILLYNRPWKNLEECEALCPEINLWLRYERGKAGTFKSHVVLVGPKFREIAELRNGSAVIDFKKIAKALKNNVAGDAVNNIQRIWTGELPRFGISTSAREVLALEAAKSTTQRG